MVTVSVRRPAPDVLDPRVKSLNYLNSVLAKREARLRGADEALILNSAGMVAEAAVANVFVFRRGALLTPPPTDGALEGVTRGAVLELAAGLGIPADERSLTRMDLISADEVFLSGTGARIVGVRSLDGADRRARARADHREARRGVRTSRAATVRCSWLEQFAVCRTTQFSCPTRRRGVCACKQRDASLGQLQRHVRRH